MKFSLSFKDRPIVQEGTSKFILSKLFFERFSVCALAVGSATLMISEVQAAAFRAGAAQIDISTRAVIPMGGYGTFFLSPARTNGVGVHDPLYASAVVFESSGRQRIAIVSVDVVGLSGAQISRIERAARDALDPNLHLIISATHTHHSPDTLGLWGSLPKSGRNARYQQQLETATVQAVRDAFSRLVPARLTQRTGRHANSTSDLANPAERNDGFVSLGIYAAQDDALIGTLTQWSAHPTVLRHDNNALSSDFIGGFRKSMSLALGQQPHVYVNGIVGNVYSLLPKAGDPDAGDDLFPEGDRDPDVKEGYAQASTVGRRLAQSVLAAAESAISDDDTRVDMCHVPVKFPVDNQLFKLASNLKVVETKVRSGFITSRVSAANIGPFVFASIPGEAFPKMIHRLDASVLSNRQPVWMGLAQDWLGYFVDEEDYDKPELKYWTDLSVHRTGAKVLLEGLSKALKHEECRNFDSIE
jgi:hypothetical protein